jgi:hypothetical protein
MTKSDIFKDKFPEFVGEVDAYKYDYYGDVKEIINTINVPGNWASYTYYFTAECGCCTDRDTDSDSLDYVLDDMTDCEFEELCEEVAKRL